MTQAQMTTEQFAAWAKAAEFTLTQGAELTGERENEVGFTNEGEPIVQSKGFGIVWKVAQAYTPCGARVEVTYQSGVEWDGNCATRFSDDFETYRDGVDEWTLSGITLVAEDGDAYSRQAMDDSVLEYAFGSSSAHDLTDIDIDALLPAVQTEDIDMDTTKKTITVERDNAPALRFSGEEIASVSSKASDSSRWTVLKLFRTAGGKYICQSIGKTYWEKETDRYSGDVADDEAGVIAFFGQGRLAKELYDDAGIDNAQDVE